MLRFRRFVPGVIVAAVLIAIAWTISRSGVMTQWSSTGPPQASRLSDTPDKDGNKIAGPGDTARPNAATIKSAAPMPETGSNYGMDDEINSKLATIERRINELVELIQPIDKKLNDFANRIDAIRQTRGRPRIEPEPSTWPRLEFWALSLLGLLTLSAVVALSISIRSRQQRGNGGESRSTPHFEEATLTGVTRQLLSKFQDQSDRADQMERTLERLQSAMRGLIAEIRKLPAGVSNQAVMVDPAPAPSKPSSTAGDVAPPRGSSPAPPEVR